MIDILVLTVGRSAPPLVNSINSLQPSRVVFLCTTGSRDVVDAVLREVPMDDFDADRDVVELQQKQSRRQTTSNDLDRLDQVYLAVQAVLKRLRQESPAASLGVDYTGGTKTMAAGLAMAAIDAGQVTIYLTTNDLRNAQEASISGYSAPVPMASGLILGQRLLGSELPQLLEQHDYAAAQRAIGRLRGRTDLDSDLQDVLLRLQKLMQIFDAWDRFDHLQAVRIFSELSLGQRTSPYALALKRVIGSRRLLDQVAEQADWPAINGHGLEAVEDLLANAERRARQSRYDDAVGRLYRAMELTAQVLLKTDLPEVLGADGIDTGNLDPALLPEAIRAPFSEQLAGKPAGEPLQIGLKQSYELLAELGHPAGRRWSQQRSLLLDQLQRRNHSLFAHGFAPIGYASWQGLRDAIGGFLQETVADSSAGTRFKPLPQFPRSLEQLQD